MNKLSRGNIKDINHLKMLGIPFHYRELIPIEVTDKKSFRWILYKEDKEIYAFHRSTLVAGWAFLAGIYIDAKVSNIWLAQQLTRYSIEDLSNDSFIGILAWVESPDDSKSQLLKRLGFTLYPNYIQRLIFDREGILNFKNMGPSKPTNYWRIAHEDDYPRILNLLKSNSSFIDTLPLQPSKSKDKWYICFNNDDILAAINWWLHGDTLEIHFTLSKERDFDITEGILELFYSTINSVNLNFFKINIEESRKVTFIRLLPFKPKTYRHGFKSYILIKNN